MIKKALPSSGFDLNSLLFRPWIRVELRAIRMQRGLQPVDPTCSLRTNRLLSLLHPMGLLDMKPQHPASFDDHTPLIWFYGSWLQNEKRSIRAAIEQVEPTLGLGPPRDAFFPARWLATSEISRVGMKRRRQYTAYRPGHSRVLSAFYLTDLCAQIRGVAAPVSRRASVRETDGT